MIVKNGVIRDVKVMRKLPVAQWPTIFPFVVLYLIEAVLYVNPTLVWSNATYIIWLTYIDFFHSVLFPVTMFLQAIFALLTVWSLRFTCAVLHREVDFKNVLLTASKANTESTRATAEATLTGIQVVVYTHPHKGTSEVVPLKWRTVTKDGESRLELYFMFQQRKWWLNPEKGIFVKPAFPTKLSMKHYAVNSGIRTEGGRQAALDAFGPNEIHVDIPSFMELFVDHALAPFFVFQMFCVMLWCMDEYWYYSIFTGFMMIVMEGTVVMQRLRNMKTMRQMGEQPKLKINCWRNGAWKTVTTQELLPLDVIIVPMSSPSPCDLVLVKGTVVANESMLTGESTPQLKEPIINCDDALVMKQHSRHVVFSGTNVLLSSASSSSEVGSPGGAADAGYPRPPIGQEGATGVVLRIGFETKQGKLVRTIIHSQSRVSENSGEAFLFIAFLLCFAVAAVGYLLHRGIADPSRSRWKLFLSCTQILTSVVPPELPMELSLAVNTSLLALIKQRIFCTEPFRIPFAGKITTCCFDKTGTLTTDEMLFTGVDRCDERKLRTTLDSIPMDAEEVLCGCHSLVLVDSAAAQSGGAMPSSSGGSGPKELTGDAMEKAAVDVLKWSMSGDTITRDETLAVKPAPASSKPGGAAPAPSAKTVPRPGGRKILKIRTRFPFNPTLRRMSCVVSDATGDKYVVAKGSPESIRSILKAVPATYDEVYQRYGKRGYRVIALARKPLSGLSAVQLADYTRTEAEQDLIFSGFAIFQCPLKSDSAATIANLQGGSNRCAIITGDSIDTAVAVARDVGIVDIHQPGQPPAYVNTVNATSGASEWVNVDDDNEQLDFDHFSDSSTAKKKGTAMPQLCINAEVLSADAFEEVVLKYADYVQVWARCAPSQKESIVSQLKHNGALVLMAGDGTNDVGGLKQAHVGIAVLNSSLLATAKDGDQAQGDAIANMKITPMPPPLRPDAGFKERMNHAMQEARHKAETQRQKQLTTMREKQQEEAKKKGLPPPGSKQLTAASSTSTAITTAAPTGQEALTVDPTDPMSLADSMFNDMDDTMGVPMVKLGDASIAAPFTCKSKNMSSVVDIVRMGRCTLVTTLQMYKILALNCLISAYSMSVLHSDGIKYGDKQMMLSGILIAVCFLLLSRSQPLETLSPERPITKVFHPYMVVSILGQFAVHLYSLISSVMLVKQIDPDAILEQSKEVDVPDFRPTLLNSIVFLMTTIMTITTFAVNYRGRPFMTGLFENKPMLYSIAFLSFIIIYCASEVDPDTNEMLEIVPFPSEDFRNKFLQLLATDVCGTFTVEFISRMLFIRKN